MKKYTLAEFFCGCGGFSRGFRMSGRFNPILGNDIKKAALRSYRFNNTTDGITPAIIDEDIRIVPLAKIDCVLQERGVNPKDLDCMIGGPPCQGFSQLRRSEERENGQIVKFRGYSKLASDPRNDLVLRFLEIAEHLAPKAIVIENVPQMLNHGHEGRLGRLADIVVDMLENELGYSVKVDVLNAANYGVPQLRERAIILAVSGSRASFPEPTHRDPLKCSPSTPQLPWTTVREALLDLPEPSLEYEKMGGGSINLYKDVKSGFSQQLRSSIAFPCNHITRRYRESVLRIIREMRPGETWDAASERMRAAYSMLIEAECKNGDNQEKALERLVRAGTINPVFFKKYYWSAYSRLCWDLPALTITANANFLGSGRFTHPEAMRGVTMREAARLQSFDDDFKFITEDSSDNETSNIGVGMDMIGEAVPPFLAKALGGHLASILDSAIQKTG